MSEILKENYTSVQQEIVKICQSCGRNPKDVKLMLVSKTVPVDRIQETIDLGHRLFGENKVQELTEKRAQLPDPNVEFHFIGHLQTNKVKKCLEAASLIHSVDRMSLAEELDKQLKKLNKTMDILIQVNTSAEESKFGVSPESALSLVKEVAPLTTLNIKGLMTLAKFSSQEEEVRPCFKLLKQLAETVRAADIPGVSMDELSMGMSSDYKIAIEEGSTLVRVGTAIFGERKYSDSYYWPENKS